jgi:hypothetical protein
MRRRAYTGCVTWHPAYLQDLREAYLEDYGGRGQLRDVRAAAFDRRLQEVAQRAMLLD